MLIMLLSCTGPETLYFQKYKCKKDKSEKGEKKNSVTKFLDFLKGFNSLISIPSSIFERLTNWQLSTPCYPASAYISRWIKFLGIEMNLLFIMNLLKNTVWIPLFLNHLQFSHHAELEGTMSMSSMKTSRLKNINYTLHSHQK